MIITTSSHLIKRCAVGFLRYTSTQHKIKLKHFNDIPGPKSYPIVGTLYKYLPYFGGYDDEALDKNAWSNWCRYGDIVREEPKIRLVHVFDPDDMETIFRQDDRYPSRRSHVAMSQYRLGKPKVYKTGGLLTTNGPEWWRLRSTFQKNFTSPQSTKGHIKDIDGIVHEFVNWIISKGMEFTDFLPYLNKLNLEIIGVVAFDERFYSFSEEEQSPESCSNRIIEAAFGSNAGIVKLDKGFMWKLFITPLYRKLANSQECLEKYSMDILQRKAMFYENNTKDDKSLLSSFLKQPNIDFKDITGMMVDILMAAVDTTSYSTSFLLYHISRNEECQKALFQELSELLPHKDSEITADVINKAVYTKGCIKESLRLNPVSIGIGRILHKDIVLKDYLIPKDTVVVTQNMLSSRLPQYVKEPLQFKPERWLRNSIHFESIHPFLSIPFGFGPRSCIARRLAEQNMSVILIKLVRNFKLEWMGDELGVKTLLINKPDKNIHLKFTTRDL